MTVEADMNLSLYSMLDLEDETGYDAAKNYNNGFDIGLGVEYQISKFWLILTLLRAIDQISVNQFFLALSLPGGRQVRSNSFNLAIANNLKVC
ncbi:MAG: hypothetical protein JEZ09_03010 [Salinivirgaceae bacterium]|nr:hypothetical protein [Salinivirgaceae bacterium]